MKGKTVLKPKNKKNPKQDEQIITKENTENKIIIKKIIKIKDVYIW